MKYFMSSLGFWSKNVTSILNKNILLLKKKKRNKHSISAVICNPPIGVSASCVGIVKYKTHP